MIFLLVLFLFLTPRLVYAQQREHKMFLCTGAVSGDHLGAWYCKELKKQGLLLRGQAIGGSAIEQEGITLLHHFNDIQATHMTATSGIFTRMFRLPGVFSRVKQLAKEIIDQKVDEVVLIDFPFFNLPLARALKKISPQVKVTYVAPPELWFWRGWGMQYFLKWYCDKVIVLYPFEQQWYREQLGLEVSWLGYPFYDRLYQYVQTSPDKQPTIALLPGSRPHEILALLPTLAQVVAVCHTLHPEVSFILPLADTIPLDAISSVLEKYNVSNMVKIITDQDEKYKALSACCCALTKPGTITLELALLQVPSIVLCKVGWMTYWLSWFIVRQKYVSLPNIFMQQPVFVELFQGDCSPARITKEVERLYGSFKNNGELYQTKMQSLRHLHEQFRVA